MPENLFGTSGRDSVNTTSTTATVQTFDGDDDVWIWASNGGVQTVDVGDGDDLVLVQLPFNSAPTDITLTLGAGRDTVRIYQIQQPLTVTDFTTGAQGDRVDFRNTLDQWVNGWDGHTNPFRNGGYFRLMQAGADTVLQIDKHSSGVAGTWVGWVVFKNTSVQSFTAENFGGAAPDGSPPLNLVLQGTAAGDTLDDGYGADQLYGGGGSDALTSGPGDDLLEGGDGDDVLKDDFGGADRLLGGAGRDTLQVTALSTTNGLNGRSALMDGGTGNDQLFYQARNETSATFVGLGGAGDDIISFFGTAAATVDAGSGADRVTFDRSGASSITLGEGRDVAVAYIPKDGQVTSGTHVIHFTDFQAGLAGDRLDIVSLVDFVGWNGQSSLLGSNYVSIAQAGADTQIRIAPYGGGNANTTIILDNVQLSSLTPFNLSGLSPNAPYNGMVKSFSDTGAFTGGDGDDLLTGQLNSVTFSGGNGGDRLEGGSGSDMLNGGDGDDFLFGGAADDHLFGGTGADTLFGETGADRLHGGAGGDILVGGPDGDVLEGGAGADLFEGARLDLAGDVILDFERGDVLKINDVDPAGFNFVRRGATLLLSTGETLILANNPHGDLIAVNGGANSVLLMLTDSAEARIAAPLNVDFNGDGLSDLAWREAGGMFTTWHSAWNGHDLAMSPNQYVTGDVDPGQRLAAADDFNGDGKSDLLWRANDGAFSIWTGTGSGFLRAVPDTSVTADWRLAATGDFNADGKVDLIWRHANGVFSVWTSDLFDFGGGFVQNSYVRGDVDSSWTLAGVGDFNGDWQDDLVWRHTDGAFTIWSANGAGFAENTVVDGSVSSDWSLAGIGDFNGDGRDDFIWRHQTGTFSEWRSNGQGFDKNVYVDGRVGIDWSLESTGDFNGDGLADLMWRHDTGLFTIWESTGSGFVTNTLIDGSVDANWSAASSDFLLAI